MHGPLFEQWRTSGREVAVVGLGKSGVAAALLLREHGVAVYASDIGTGPTLDAWAAKLGEAGATVHIGAHDLERIARAAAVVVAPGVPPEAPPLEPRARAGVPIVMPRSTSASWRSEGPAASRITGTNGKTTTTRLVGARACGRRGPGRDGGQHRRAALLRSRSASDRHRIGSRWSSRRSSSTTRRTSSPRSGVLTNLAPNHLDRYHSLEEYYGDKALLFRNADAESICISNADDPAVQDMVRAVPGGHFRFSVRERADGWYDAKAGG